MKKALYRLTDATSVFAGALQVLQNKGLVTNEEIKKAVEETIAKTNLGKPGDGSGNNDAGRRDSGVSEPQSTGTNTGGTKSASVGISESVNQAP